MPTLVSLLREIREMIFGYLHHTGRLVPAVPFREMGMRKPLKYKGKRIMVDAGYPQQNRICRRTIEGGVQLHGLVPISEVSKEFNQSYHAYLRLLVRRQIQQHTKQKIEGYQLIFLDMAEMSHFLRNLHPLGRARISYIATFWNHERSGPPPYNASQASQQILHTSEHAAPFIFKLVETDCSNLKTLIVKIDLRRLREYDAEGHRRAVAFADGEIEGTEELKNLRRMVRSVERGEVIFSEVDIRQHELDRLLE